MTRLIRFFTLIALLAAPGLATAQNGGPYAPRVIVNDRVVSNYEVQQRIQFMKLLNAPGDLEEVALEGLIDDRLRLYAAKRLGIALAPEQVEEGMSEFAARANLSTEEFVAALGQAGVSAQTFRDFVESGIVWREVVRARFGPRAQVTEDEIDRAMALATRQGGARVLLSEIILQADTPEAKDRAQALAERLSREIKTPTAFAAAARNYSVSATRGRGGRLDWIDLGALPQAIGSAVLGLAPGQVSDPIQVPNAVALFLMRGLEETDLAEPTSLSVEYARFFLSKGTQDEVDRIDARVDTCDDLYGVAKGLPEEQLQREVTTVAELPQDIALELAKLDDNEFVVLNRGGTPSMLMLCGRTPELPEGVDRGTIRTQLINQRLGSYADGFLAELRSDAIIRYP